MEPIIGVTLLIFLAIIIAGGSSGSNDNHTSVRHCPNCSVPLPPGARECSY